MSVFANKYFSNQLIIVADHFRTCSQSQSESRNILLRLFKPPLELRCSSTRPARTIDSRRSKTRAICSRLNSPPSASICPTCRRDFSSTRFARCASAAPSSTPRARWHPRKTSAWWRTRWRSPKATTAYAVYVYMNVDMSQNLRLVERTEFFQRDSSINLWTNHYRALL